VPWTCRTAIGADGAHLAGSAYVTPEIEAMAVTLSARSQAIRWLMNPPFECPAT